jgi:phosphoglycolate phosphatase
MSATSIVRFDNFIFDLDGTLVNSAAGIQAAFGYAWNVLYPNKLVPDIQKAIGPPIDKIFLGLVDTASENEVSLFVRNFRKAYDEWGWKLTVLYDDVLPFLELLRQNGRRCFGVTNKPYRPTQSILTILGLDKEFFVFLSPDSHQPAFPSKTSAVEYLMIEFDLKYQNTIVVGDTLEDAQVAKNVHAAFLLRENNPAQDVFMKSSSLFICKDFSECSFLIK